MGENFAKGGKDEELIKKKKPSRKGGRRGDRLSETGGVRGWWGGKDRSAYLLRGELRGEGRF